MKKENKLKIIPQVLDRLNFFANGPVEYKEDEKSAVAFYGLLYGVQVKELSDLPVICNVTGNSLFDADADNVEVDVLSELFPIGIDPVGVVYLSSGNDFQAGKLRQVLNSLAEKEVFRQKNVVMLSKCANDPLNISVVNIESNEVVEENVGSASIEMEQVEKFTTTIRLRGKLEMLTALNERDIVTWIQHCVEKVSCPYGSFQLDNSDVFFLHSFAVQKRSLGWTATESFKEEYVEECHVSNIESLDPDLSSADIAEQYTVDDLWQLTFSSDDDDDGFGPKTDKKKPAKKTVNKKETMDFKLWMKMSGDACTSRTRNCAPVIHYEKVDSKVAKIPLNIDGLAVAANDMKIVDLMELLKGCIQRQVHILGGSILSEFKKLASVSKPQVFHLKPGPLGHFVSIVYTETGSCSLFAPFRLKLARKFLLLPDRPHFRRMNRFTFQADLSPGSGPLNNVHVGLPPSGVNGEVAIVQGTYTYHHYMQNNFDDNGWGCAYRSLQTLISWFRHQGYAATPIPTHEQIQKCLVDIGDKERSFIGSRQWIGSTEVGYVLEKSCDVQSKFLSLSSGEEMENKGRELAHHFKTNGTPIMIGGGVLAHTILGVDWDEAGNIAWLVLDPHYTGSDWTNDKKPNLSYIQSKGWVGWKKPGFWDKNAFYNLCLPQRPAMF